MRQMMKRTRTRTDTNTNTETKAPVDLTAPLQVKMHIQFKSGGRGDSIPVVLDALPLQVSERPEAKGFIDHHVQVRECLDRCRPLLMFYVTYFSYYTGFRI